VAVVELLNPTYDEATHTATYDIAVLANWQEGLEMEFAAAPTALAALAPSFGTAHLLIDDCPQTAVICEAHYSSGFWAEIGTLWNIDSCWNYSVCMPCEPYGHVQPDGCATVKHWTVKCNQAFPEACQGNCKALFSWPFADFGC
jgi:hypothetical protein